MRRFIIGLALLAALAISAAPSFAQFANPDQEKADKAAAAQVDRQYKAMIDRTRKEGSEPRVDPWSNMRGTDGSKPKR